MKKWMNLACRRQLQFVGHFTDFVDNLVRPKILEGKLVATSPILLQERHLTHFKTSLSSVFISLVFHSLLSTMQMLSY